MTWWIELLVNCSIINFNGVSLYIQHAYIIVAIRPLKRCRGVPCKWTLGASHCAYQMPRSVLPTCSAPLDSEHSDCPLSPVRIAHILRRPKNGGIYDCLRLKDIHSLTPRVFKHLFLISSEFFIYWVQNLYQYWFFSNMLWQKLLLLPENIVFCQVPFSWR